jgi:hypothetical protein
MNFFCGTHIFISLNLGGPRNTVWETLPYKNGCSFGCSLVKKKQSINMINEIIGGNTNLTQEYLTGW